MQDVIWLIINPNYIMNTKQLYLAPEAEALVILTEGVICESQLGGINQPGPDDEIITIDPIF